MEQKLIIESDLSIAELNSKISGGAKFITFEYCISVFFAVTLRRFSPAIYIDEPLTFKKYKRKYNTLSLLFGWWGIPWGPFHTVRSIRLNKKGGLDCTDDIMLNIDENCLANKVVEVEQTTQLFCKPDKWDIKAFRKALVNEFERDYKVKKIVVALYINTEDEVQPHKTIGFLVESNVDEFQENLKQALLTQFRKYAQFEFINLNEKNEMSMLLEQQGEVIINR